MTEKNPCRDCGALILPTTGERTGGLCMPCFKESQRDNDQEGGQDSDNDEEEAFPGFEAVNLLADFKHFDHALELVKEVVATKQPGWQRAFLHQIFYLNNLEKHREAAALIRENPDMDFSLITETVIESLWAAQDVTLAGLRQLRHVQSQARIPEELYAAKPRNKMWQGNTRLLLADGMAQGFLPATTLEYILPLITGAREVVAGFGDEFLMESSEETILHSMATWLWNTFHIYCFPFNFAMVHGDSIAQFFKLFLFREPRYFQPLQEMQAVYARFTEAGNFKEAEKSVFLREGKLLGFPQCCIDRFSAHRFSQEHLPFEKTVSFEVLTWRRTSRKRFPLSLSCFEFYPCDINCQNAMEIAKELRRRYRIFDEAALRIFDDVLLEAHLYAVLKWDQPGRKSVSDVWPEKICSAFHIDWFGRDHIRKTLELRADCRTS